MDADFHIGVDLSAVENGQSIQRITAALKEGTSTQVAFCKSLRWTTAAIRVCYRR